METRSFLEQFARRFPCKSVRIFWRGTRFHGIFFGVAFPWFWVFICLKSHVLWIKISFQIVHRGGGTSKCNIPLSVKQETWFSFIELDFYLRNTWLSQLVQHHLWHKNEQSGETGTPSEHAQLPNKVLFGNCACSDGVPVSPLCSLLCHRCSLVPSRHHASASNLGADWLHLWRLEDFAPWSAARPENTLRNILWYASL